MHVHLSRSVRALIDGDDEGVEHSVSTCLAIIDLPLSSSRLFADSIAVDSDLLFEFGYESSRVSK